MKKIVSVSYKDDTPAFFSEEFFKDVKRGYRAVSTRYGSKRVSLLPEDVHCFVFWTKNCSDHFIANMQTLNVPYYVQWTITGYGKDIEPMVPDKNEVIERFKTVSGIIGPRRTIWRYDPILMSEKYTAEYHIRRFREMCEAMKGFTTRCVISFFDEYGKIQKEIRQGIMRKPTLEEINMMAEAMSRAAADNGMTVQTCAERGYDLTRFGIHEGPCVDAAFIESEFGIRLEDSIKQPDSFRPCNCAVNTDIGTYHRCRHDCKYCYAK